MGRPRTRHALGAVRLLAQFLQISGRFDLWVKDCPWVYTSPNAAVRDVCGICC